MMEKLFLDTNIVLDLIGNREPFVKEAAFLFQLGRNKECQLFVSDLTFVNIAYITRKTYPKEKLYSVLSKLRSFLTIVGGGVVAVDHALALQADDFEDAVQYYAARQADADYIITRNKKDFSFSVDDIFLQIESYRFGHTEIFHRFRNRYPQSFTQLEKMINCCSCRENNSCVIQNRNFLLSEFFWGYFFYLNERTKLNIYTVLFCNVEIRRFLRSWLWLRNEYFLDFQNVSILNSTNW